LNSVLYQISKQSCWIDNENAQTFLFTAFIWNTRNVYFIYRHTNTLFIVFIFNVFPGKEYEDLIYLNKKNCKLALRVKRTLRPCSPKIYISRFNLLLKFLWFSFKFHWITIKISVDYFQILQIHYAWLILFHS